MDDRISYLTEYLNIVLPFCSSNRAAVRHFAVSMICAVGPWIQSEQFWNGNKKARNDGALRSNLYGHF